MICRRCRLSRIPPASLWSRGVRGVVSASVRLLGPIRIISTTLLEHSAHKQQLLLSLSLKYFVHLSEFTEQAFTFLCGSAAAGPNGSASVNLLPNQSASLCVFISDMNFKL